MFQSSNTLHEVKFDVWSVAGFTCGVNEYDRSYPLYPKRIDFVLFSVGPHTPPTESALSPSADAASSSSHSTAAVSPHPLSEQWRLEGCAIALNQALTHEPLPLPLPSAAPAIAVVSSASSVSSSASASTVTTTVRPSISKFFYSDHHALHAVFSHPLAPASAAAAAAMPTPMPMPMPMPMPTSACSTAPMILNAAYRQTLHATAQLLESGVTEVRAIAQAHRRRCRWAALALLVLAALVLARMAPFATADPAPLGFNAGNGAHLYAYNSLLLVLIPLVSCFALVEWLVAVPYANDELSALKQLHSAIELRLTASAAAERSAAVASAAAAASTSATAPTL